MDSLPVCRGAACISALAIFLALTPSATAQGCLAAKDAISEAFESSPRLLSAQSAIEQERFRVKGIRSTRRPQASAFIRSGIGDGALESAQLDNQVGIQLSYQIFDFGQSRFALNGAKALVDARRADLDALKRSVGTSLLSLFIDVAEARALQALYAGRVETLDARLQTAGRQLENNSITRMDFSRLEAEAALNTLNLVEAQGEEKSALLSLGRILQLEITCTEQGTAEVFINGNRHVTVEEAILDLARRPEIAALSKEISAAGSDLEAARRGWLPKLRASGYTSQVYDDFTDSFDSRDRIGIEVTAPLYDGGSASSEAGRTKARLDQLRAELAMLQNELRTEARTNWEMLSVLDQSVSATKQAVRSEQAYVDAVKRRFELGAGTVDDLLEAEERLLNLEVRLVALDARRNQVVIGLIRNSAFD